MEHKYISPDSDLDLSWDLNYIEKLMLSADAKVESETRRYILDLAYTLARKELDEARRLANLANKSVVDIGYLKITKMEKTEDFQWGSLQLTKSIIQHPTTPAVTTSLLLPPWRNCQVGANAELKQLIPQNDDKETANNAVATANKLQVQMQLPVPRIGPRCPKPNF